MIRGDTKNYRNFVILNALCGLTAICEFLSTRTLILYAHIMCVLYEEMNLDSIESYTILGSHLSD